MKVVRAPRNSPAIIRQQPQVRLQRGIVIFLKLIRIDIRLYLNSAAEVRPKDGGACEDAYFSHKLAVGVSDGVGGWANYGITAANFSASLMENCRRAIEQTLKPVSNQQVSLGANSSVQDSILFDIECDVSSDQLDDSKGSERYNDSRIMSIDPVSIISRAFRSVHDTGSATAVLCVLKNDQLVCSNIGDSGFRLIRFDEDSQPFIVMESEEQQHDFNTPYQLSKLPTAKCIEEKLRLIGYNSTQTQGMVDKYKTLVFCQDDPETGKLYQTRVQEGDLLVLGSDGLFDNLFPEEILEAVHDVIKSGGKGVPPGEIAKEIGERAYLRSVNSREESPFSRKYSEVSKGKVVVCTLSVTIC